jgi:hypothetical protein
MGRYNTMPLFIPSSQGGGGGFATTVATDGSGDYNTTGTNDELVVQAAGDAVLAAGGGRLSLKAGTYNFNTTGVKFTLSGKSLIIEGEGSATVINNLTGSSSHANDCFWIVGATTVNADYIAIKELKVVGNSTGGMGFYLDGCYQGALDNIVAQSFTAGSGWGCGINLSQSISIVITNPICKGNSYAGIQLGNVSNANTVIGGWLYQNTSGGSAPGARVSSANRNVFVGTIFEANNYGIITGGRSTALIGCWIEANTIVGMYAQDTFSSLVKGCFFTGNTLDIDVRAAQRAIHISENNFNDGGKITLQSTAAGVLIRDNYNFTTLTDNGATELVIRNNNAFDPENVYAQGNVTGATTFNRVNGDHITATLTGNITVTLTAGKAPGDELTLELTQDGTGSRLVTWPSNFKKAGGTLTLTTTAAAIDVIKMRWDGTNWHEVSRSLNNS